MQPMRRNSRLSWVRAESGRRWGVAGLPTTRLERGQKAPQAVHEPLAHGARRTALAPLDAGHGPGVSDSASVAGRSECADVMQVDI
jgi:hypothetical protein